MHYCIPVFSRRPLPPTKNPREGSANCARSTNKAVKNGLPLALTFCAALLAFSITNRSRHLLDFFEAQEKTAIFHRQIDRIFWIFGQGPPFLVFLLCLIIDFEWQIVLETELQSWELLLWTSYNNSGSKVQGLPKVTTRIGPNFLVWLLNMKKLPVKLAHASWAGPIFCSLFVVNKFELIFVNFRFVAPIFSDNCNLQVSNLSLRATLNFLGKKRTTGAHQN